jgi:hypothetical protein
MQPVGIVVTLVVVLHDLFRQVRREPVVAFPNDAMGLVGGVDNVDGADVGGIFLRDASKDTLGTGSLNAHGNSGVLCLECLAKAFSELQVHRRIKRNLAFLFRRLDQGRSNCFRRRRRSNPNGKGAEAKRSRPPKHITFRELFDHGVLDLSLSKTGVGYL